MEKEMGEISFRFDSDFCLSLTSIELFLFLAAPQISIFYNNFYCVQHGNRRFARYRMIMIVCSLLLFIYYWTYRYSDDYALRKSDLTNDSYRINVIE